MQKRVACLLSLLALSNPALAQDNDGERIEIPGQLVVCFETLDTSHVLQATVQEWDLGSAAQSFSIDSSRSILQWQRRGETVITNVVLLEYSPVGLKHSVLQAWLAEVPGVQWAAPNVEITGDVLELVPNDPQYGSQYHHPLMQNDLAWNITLGDSSIVIGVTDGGVDTDHVDLIDNIWINAGEIPGDGIDNDANGYIDDINGYDFVFDNNDPNPNSSGDDHGTHVAGISAAKTNNNVGVAGTAGDSSIMGLQFYSSGQAWTAVNIAEAFAYGADNGAQIIVTSYNMDGWVGDMTVTAAYDYMYDNGVLHFNSAGNGGSANPPRQSFHQTMLVASTDSGDNLSSFSNWGTGIDLSAPGSSILSTVLNDAYGTKSGTSMAAPNAAGVAALIWAANPTWSSAQVAAQISATADNIDAQNPSVAGLLGGGRANSFRALTETTLPAPQLVSAEGLPSEGGALIGELSSITLRFDQILDPAAVNTPGAFTLTYAGLDNVFGNGDDTVVPVNWDEYLFAANEITLSVNGTLPSAGQYRFTAQATLLSNPFGTAIDGNGDGTPGDSWLRHFSACATLVSVEDNAESGADWSVEDDANLTAGSWTTNPVVPSGGGVRNDPPTDYDGSGKCFVTQDGPGNTDVDGGGQTKLISRAFDLSGIADPYLSFAQWLVTSGDDVMQVHVSGDNGASWTLVQTISGGSGWEVESFRVTDFVTPGAQTRMRFSVADTGGASITEAGIDFLRVLEIDCVPSPPVGTAYCVGAPNSAGAGASIRGMGSSVVAQNDFTLVTEQLPPGTIGLYFFGSSQVQLPLGNGFRCVGGTTGRFNPASPSNLLGVASRSIDLTAAPAVGLILAGTTFNFQYWYRDPAAGGAQFNLSDGLSVLFQ